MRLNDIKATTSSGGTGTLTLTRQTGWALPSDAWTGTRVCEYTIIEWTDATKLTPLQTESGIGSVAISGGPTNVLTRTKISQSWLPSGPTYLPLFGTATAPSAINFGTTSANIDVFIGPSAYGGPTLIPFKMGALTNVSDGVGLPGFGPMVTAGVTMSLATGNTYYFPVDIRHTGPFSQAAVRVVAAATGGTPTVSVALYEIASTGLPGKMLVNFGSLGAPTTANATLQNAAIATPVDVGIGLLWCGLLYVANGATGSPTIRATNPTIGPHGTLFTGTTGFPGISYISSQSALNDPATTPNSTNNGASANGPLVAFL